MKGKENKDGEDEAEIKPSERLGEMELVNCTDYEIETRNRTLSPSDEKAFVEDEKTNIPDTVFITREKHNTRNLPKPKENVLYIVSREVFYNEPKRIDLVTPSEHTFNNGTMIVDKFEIHPDILRGDVERDNYRRFPTCPHCGSKLQYKRWKSNAEYRDGARRVVQLHRKSRSGVNSLITMQIPDLGKEIDFMIRGKDLVAKETEISNEEELTIDEREM